LFSSSLPTPVLVLVLFSRVGRGDIRRIVCCTDHYDKEFSCVNDDDEVRIALSREKRNAGNWQGMPSTGGGDKSGFTGRSFHAAGTAARPGQSASH
jgi:hypothetical protein